MGHNLIALIATGAVTDEVCLRVPPARVIVLQQGFGMIPLAAPVSNVLGDQHPLSGPVIAPLGGHNTTPDHQLEALCAEVSTIGGVALISAYYQGGVGYQLAAVWSGGRAVYAKRSAGWGGKKSFGPINGALRILGVKGSWRRDEFDAVGLGEHRDLEDFDPEYS